MRLNASELIACAGSAFATLALMVAGWQLFPASAQPHINKHEQHSASTPALSASAAVRGELESIAASVSETPDRRPLKRRKRQPRIGEERRAYKPFQRPADKIDTAEVVMIAAEDVLSAPNESPYPTSF